VGADVRNNSMRESDRAIDIDLGLWLEKTVKKLLFWIEIEEGDENGKVLGSVRDEKWGRFLFWLDQWKVGRNIMFLAVKRNWRDLL
jgi:hypothetical protein